MSRDPLWGSTDNNSLSSPIEPSLKFENELLPSRCAKRARLIKSDQICDTRDSLRSFESSDISDKQISSVDRLSKLTDLVDNCSHEELVHLSKTIEPLLKRDFLVLLPIELSWYILSYLSLRDILCCAQVSLDWRRITSDPLLWRRLCMRDGIVDAISPSVSPVTCGSCPRADESLLGSRTGNTYAAFKERKPPSVSVDMERNWKDVYRRSLETRCNWLHGSPWSPIVLNAHHNHVITCLEVYNEWAITGSDDSSICVWSLTHGDLVISLFGHIGGVWSLAILPPFSRNAPSLLVSGSCDRTARVWSLDGSHWPCLTTLFGHQSTVRCLAGQQRGPVRVAQFDQNSTREEYADLLGQHLVVTGSRDTTLRLWNALSGRCLRVFQGHRGAVRCVQFCGHVVVSGSYDCTVRVWCIRTGNCLRTLDAHRNRVYTLLFDGLRIISASLDTTICVWDMGTGLLMHTFCGHQSLTSEMAYGRAQRVLVSSNADETIRVWDVETGQCLHVLAGRYKHQSAVTCVQLTRHFIVSSGDDGTVKLWDRLTGSYIRDLVRLDGAGRGGVIWRIVCSDSRLVCAAGSRNGLESTKLIILHFDDPTLFDSDTNRITHVCRPRSDPAPPPKLSELIAAHAFDARSGSDPSHSDPS